MPAGIVFFKLTPSLFATCVTLSPPSQSGHVIEGASDALLGQLRSPEGGPARGDSASVAMVLSTSRMAGPRTDWRLHALPAEQSSIFSQCDGAAASLAWSDGASTFPATSTLVVEIIEDGPDGAPIATAGDTVEMHYAALIRQSGCCVDASRSKAFGDRHAYQIQLKHGPRQDVVEGMACGVRSLRLGSIGRLHVPSHLAYGDFQSGPIKPNTDLVFEVEILAINGQRAPPRDHWRVRQLLMMPPPDPIPGSATHDEQPSAPTVEVAACPLNDGSRAILTRQPPARLHAALVAMAHARTTHESDSSEAIGIDACEHALPTWLTRLRPTRPLPTPECTSYFGFERLRAALLAALPKLEAEEAAARAAGALGGESQPGCFESAPESDLGPRLIPGASSIAHAPYGSPWDVTAPVVLTGARTGWPAKAWGWAYWEREHGGQYVTCKQRAPLFHEDQTADTLMAECSLREAMHYARTAHATDVARRGEAPVLYMNGWDVFDAMPELWHPDMDKLPDTIDHRTTSEFQRLHQMSGIPIDDDAKLTKKARGLCKLFIGCVGAITRIHQDNQNAHAWLCNLRGRKLYVLCRPRDAPKVARFNSGSKGHGTKYHGRLDPLDPTEQQRARDEDLELFATVLEPGQTIVAPDGWWHYAVSLTPTITLMNNFWDATNIFGLHDSFFDQVARAVDESKKHAGTQVVHAAPKGARGVTLDPPVAYRCVNKPFVFVRSEPSTASKVVGILRPSSKDYCILRVGLTLDGWLRSAEPFDRGSYGWVLEDGRPLGLPLLMERMPPEVA